MKKKSSSKSSASLFMALGGFVLGCVVSALVVLNLQAASNHSEHSALVTSLLSSSSSSTAGRTAVLPDPPSRVSPPAEKSRNMQQSSSQATSPANSIIQSVRILIAIVAFDFAQLPHLEEVLSGYHDLCTAGSPKVDVYIHATIPYPVTLIDLWNTRFPCQEFSITIVLKPASLRLHMVDCHRELFYSNLQEYDLFIYTEDDIRVTPSVVATYLLETQRVERLVVQADPKHSPSDFNVGIVRYEYNYPVNAIIDDNTRHATQNVTRVYWEHSFFRPVVPKVVDKVPQEALAPAGGGGGAARNDDADFVAMHNHHQGMFLATQSLLKAWKERRNCKFDEARNRPGIGHQPTEGTQRVWMSSQMLYGKRHCGVQQVIPLKNFGALTVLHLPNKNYRRVGKYRNRTFSDGTEVFQKPHESLLSAMELHLAVRKAFPPPPQIPYRGTIKMVDESNTNGRNRLITRRMREYQAYVDRGGILSQDDFGKVDLVETQ